MLFVIVAIVKRETGLALIAVRAISVGEFNEQTFVLVISHSREDGWLFAIPDWLIYIRVQCIFVLLADLIPVGHFIRVHEAGQCFRLFHWESGELVLAFEYISVGSHPPVVLVSMRVISHISFLQQSPQSLFFIPAPKPPYPCDCSSTYE